MNKRQIIKIPIGSYFDLKPSLSTFTIYKADKSTFEIYALRDGTSCIANLQTMFEIIKRPAKLLEINFQ